MIARSPVLARLGLMSRRWVAQIPSVHLVTSMKTKEPVINHSLEASNLRKQLLERPGLLGLKRGMITWFSPTGESYGATVIEIDLCEVVQNKTIDKEGFFAVQMGSIDRMKNITAQRRGHCEKAGVAPKRYLREFRVRDEAGLIPEGTELTADYFAVGQLVDTFSILKGKGFAGVMKRHGFKGLRASHGVSKAHRSAGSMGATQSPGRILPGKKMAGRMGGNERTVFNNEVLYANGEDGILILKGQVAGPNGCLVKVSDAKKLYGKCADGSR